MEVGDDIWLSAAGSYPGGLEVVAGSTHVAAAFATSRDVRVTVTARSGGPIEVRYRVTWPTRVRVVVFDVRGRMLRLLDDALACARRSRRHLGSL